ncbi:uncharacterized protein LOC122422607 isoform X2 [Cervus canadensis]|uniref:uncharacterized protein LOC122422607 isoform X2 n=1 Tax=Cervus canadensis TaxID=1574408 RepID=UPI001CA34C62|nr:uncharacterized protein LOC122422607 isoform X2 [Cervus canadensis]
MNYVSMLNEWTYVECPLCGSDEQLPQLTLFFSALTLHSGAETWEGKSMATGWAPLKSPPPVVPSLGPFRETKTISGTGFFTCLAGLTSTDRPTFHPSVTRSFPPDVADEGDSPSTSPREGSEPHPPAREAQCRVQVSVPMEGSAQGGVKSKRGRPPQKPPRTHPGAQSRAATRAQHTRLRPRVPSTPPSEAARGPGAQRGRAQSTSLKEGSEHHPAAQEAQCRLQVSVPMEGSAQLGMKRKRRSRAA